MNIQQVKRQDLLNKLVAASSRGEKGGGCKLSCSVDTNSSSSHGEGSLGPDGVLQ